MTHFLPGRRGSRGRFHRLWRKKKGFWKHAERADWVTHGPCLSASPGLIKPRGDLQMQGRRRRRDMACEECITEKKSPFPHYNQKYCGTKSKAWKQAPPSATPSLHSKSLTTSAKMEAEGNQKMQCVKGFLHFSLLDSRVCVGKSLAIRHTSHNKIRIVILYLNAFSFFSFFERVWLQK